MSRNLTLSDVMTPAPRTISVDAHLSDAQALMEELGVEQLPVMAGNVVEAVVFARDIARFTLPAHKLTREEDLLVGDIATTKAYVAESTDPLISVLERMVSNHASAVIVLNQGELAGIFTEGDACRVLAGILAGQNG